MNAPPEGQSQRRRPPRTPLLFDENLPWRVASALRELEYNASYVGNEQDGAPLRGSSDQEIISHARATNQVVVAVLARVVLHGIVGRGGRRCVWTRDMGLLVGRQTFPLGVYPSSWRASLRVLGRLPSDADGDAVFLFPFVEHSVDT